jgi:hypothetical protein
MTLVRNSPTAHVNLTGKQANQPHLSLQRAFAESREHPRPPALDREDCVDISSNVVAGTGRRAGGLGESKSLATRRQRHGAQGKRDEIPSTAFRKFVG